MNLPHTPLSLLSLNTFGVPFYLSLGRLKRLASELERLGTTILCLQEIQQNAYASLLTRCLTSYPYRAIIPHWLAPKGGLGTYSRLPLMQQEFELYQDRGLRWLITFADWALSKGMLVTQLQIQELDVLVVNTHLNANYSGDWRRKNPLAVIQHKQVKQLSNLIGRMPANALIVSCGDFNFPRSSFLYEELVSQNGFFDPLHTNPKPSYRPFPLVPSKWKTSLDYLLLRLPQGKDIHVQADIVEVEDTTRKHAFQRFLTDHCALKVNLEW